MKKRKGISTRTRFEIFKRDGFRCAYCGTTPIDGPLHVDHIQAVAEGGSDDPSNLITACDKCNMGKSDVPLDRRKFQTGDPERAIEHAEQLRRYMAAQKEVAAAKLAANNQLIGLWCEILGVEIFHKNLRAMLMGALEEFGMERLCDFIHIVASNRHEWAHKKDAWLTDCKYFCGVLRKRRDSGWK